MQVKGEKIFIHLRMYPWLLVSSLLLGCISATVTSTELLSFNEHEKQLSKCTESESFLESASIPDQFAQFKYVVTIDPINSKATDNDTCLSPPNEKNLCNSLDHALQIYHGLSSVLFYLAAPGEIYRLNFTYKVTNQHNIWFYGNSSLSSAIPTIKCLEHVGFSLINSSNISISNNYRIYQLWKCTEQYQ